MPIVGSSSQVTNTAEQNNPTFTFNHNHVGGPSHALLVFVGAMGGGTSDEAPFDLTVTYDGDELDEHILLNNDTFTVFTGSVRAFYIQTPSTGTNLVSVTLTSDKSVRSFVATAISLTNAAGVGNNSGIERFGSSGDTSFDYDITASAEGNLIIGMHTVRGDGRTWTEGSGYSVAVDDETGTSSSRDFSYLVQHKLAPAAGAVAFDGSWTPSNRNAGGAIEILKVDVDVEASGDDVSVSSGEAFAVTNILASGDGDATSDGIGDTLKVVAAEGVGLSVSSGVADAFIIFPDNQVDLVSSGDANAFVKVFASATAVASAVPTSSAVKIIFAAADVDSASDSEGFAIRHKLASATSDNVSSFDAVATEFSGVRGTSESVSSAEGIALDPLPAPRQVPIEDSFVIAQRPFVMVDLKFDNGEVNVWTRPFDGEFESKEYRPLAGIADGLTIRNSLDDSNLDASVQFSGQSEEMLSLALTENYQGRPAVVSLANLSDTGRIESVEILLVGQITNMSVTDDADEATVSVLIESVFKSLNRPKVIRQSTPDLQRISPDDTFFDFIETVSVTEPRFGGTS